MSAFIEADRLEALRMIAHGEGDVTIPARELAQLVDVYFPPKNSGSESRADVSPLTVPVSPPGTPTTADSEWMNAPMGPYPDGESALDGRAVEMRARAEAFLDTPHAGTRAELDTATKLARDVVTLTEVVVGLSADVTQLRETNDSLEADNTRMLNEAVESEDRALAAEAEVARLRRALAKVHAVSEFQAVNAEAMYGESENELREALRAAEVRVKELEQTVSEPPKEREVSRKLIGRELARLYAAAEAFNTGDYEIMEDALRSVAGGGEEALARLAEALPSSSVVPVEAGTGEANSPKSGEIRDGAERLAEIRHWCVQWTTVPSLPDNALPASPDDVMWLLEIAEAARLMFSLLDGDYTDNVTGNPNYVARFRRLEEALYRPPPKGSGGGS